MNVIASRDNKRELLNLRFSIRDILDRVRVRDELQKSLHELEDRVESRTSNMLLAVDLMAGREIRMIELKKVIVNLRKQIMAAGMIPVDDGPLHE